MDDDSENCHDDDDDGDDVLIMMTVMLLMKLTICYVLSNMYSILMCIVYKPCTIKYSIQMSNLEL